MDKQQFGRRLKELRQAQGLSQAELALKASIPVGTLQGIEQGQREPLALRALALANALGVSVASLFELPGEDVPNKVRPGGGYHPRKPPAPPKNRRGRKSE